MRCRPRGFTLVELLVVVAIITVLIGILLPSLGKARANARATKCGASMRSVAAAVASYVSENDGTYPPSYWYPKSASGEYDFFTQPSGHPFGYAHWSSFLFGYTRNLKAFTCPEFASGGISRTNPGRSGADWLAGQVDQNGNSSSAGASLADLQAPFVAFTANAAIMPRNKFTSQIAADDGGNGQRLNMFVKQVKVDQAGRTILMTEFNTDWRTIAASDPSVGYTVKSHRPINPFVGAGGGTDEYSTSLKTYFTRTAPSDLYDTAELQQRVNAGDSLITDKQTQLNAVGRNHPGSGRAGNKLIAGTSNFLYVDGHVERKSIAETVGGNWEWGQRYYSLNGDNRVMP